MNKVFLIGGLPGYIKWKDCGYTKPGYKYIQSFLTICINSLVAMELGAFLTQINLSEKQASDLTILSLCHLVLYSYQYIVRYHKERLRDLLYKLCISLKEVYNHPEVEKQMIRRASLYAVCILLNVLSTLISYGYAALQQAIRTDGIFVAVITAWPDVTDASTLANVGRVVGYLTWWALLARVSAVFVLLIITTGCLSYQYRNLQSYFYSLNDVFSVEVGDAEDQRNAERKYEEGLKVGIVLHAETMWFVLITCRGGMWWMKKTGFPSRCTRECQAICSIVYSSQIILNVIVFTVLMLQMANSERSIANTLKITLTAVALVCSTGILMWNAGDVTCEAALLPSAMYSSGWQNYRAERSGRIRKLLVVAITQAQKPVVIRSFGVMEISYQAFVSMVKASYSAFSILY